MVITHSSLFLMCNYNESWMQYFIFTYKPVSKLFVMCKLYSFRVHLLTDSLLHLSGVLRNVYSLGQYSHLSNARTVHGARTHASTQFTAFGFLLLASIYRHFNNFFACRVAAIE